MPSSMTAIFTSATDSTKIISHLHDEYPDTTTISSSWTLTHSLYRSTSTSTSTPSHLQILQLSTHPARTFLCTSTKTPDIDKTAAIAISRTEADADFRRLIRDKFGPLWQLSKQGEMRATGVQMEQGVLRIVVANLFRDRGAASGGVESRGTVIAISLLKDTGIGQTDNDRNTVGEFAREAFGLSSQLEAAWGDFGSWQGETSLWCEVLREHAASVAARPRVVE